MSDMPERIWAWFFMENLREDVISGGWTEEPERREQEYIRADLALTAPKVKAMVDAAKEAVEALDYSVSEIADLENTLSNYRQNWQPAAAALSVLRAALAALEGDDA